MPGVLEYALSLKTAGFDNPLRQSESGLKNFKTTAGGTDSALGGLTAAAAGATAVFATFGAVTAGALAVLDGYAEFDGLVRGMKTLEGTAAGTQARLELLRDVAKVPGLGFEEAVRGDIRLRSVGISAALSEKAMRAFGNALATVGGGKAELDGVLLALTQIQSKGVVSAEEINQIAERVPQVRAAMKEAFGTADTEAFAKSGKSVTEFMEGLVAQLSKLPQVTGGARNSLDNYSDSWKALKNTASEFAVNIAGDWIDGVSGAFQQARRDLVSLQELLGIKSPGLEGPDGAGEDIQAFRKQRQEREAAAQKLAESERAAAEQTNDFWQQKSEDRQAFEKERSDRQKEIEIRNQAEIAKAQEKAFAARLTEEQNLQRQIDALRKSGPTTAAEVNKLPANSDAQKAAAESLAELVTLEKQLADLKERNAATDAAKAATAAKQIADAAKELSARAEASALFNADNEILQARIAGNDKLVKQLERQQTIEKLKLDLMRDQGLSESEAATKAAQRIALEEKANGVRRRGILDAAASAAAKLDRRGEADPTKRQGNTDRLAQADLERRRNRPLSPARAAEQLARGNGAADPGRARREERAAAEKKGSDPLLRVVKDIADKFSNLAVS
jgi:tape measure domain-containing protein